MKKKISITTIIFVISFFQSSLCGWDNQKTHPALTLRAIDGATCELDSYLKIELGLNNGIATELHWDFPESIKERMEKAEPDRTTRSILDWIKAGSIIEDNPISRCRNHFHDPTRNSGLDDTENANIFRYFFYQGDSAEEWAINHSSNEFDWQSAREDFCHALTDPNQANRGMFLAEMFLRLGHVLHMLEDMGVPAHTRNDSLFAHVRHEYSDKFEPLERWVEIKVTDNNSLSRWISPGWTPTPRVFNKIANYFDDNMRDANNYLGDGIFPPDSWGLSEATNYQFLSWSTIFRDANSLYYFPQPAKVHTAEVNELGRTFLSGYGVNHLAQQTISYYRLKHTHLDKAWCVLGGVIYDDYADITLPRTINYATGLANYFFRGKIEASVTNYYGDPYYDETLEITIKNLSKNSDVEQVLKGGSFELYWDDQNGVRSPVSGTITIHDPTSGNWDSNSSVLAYNGTTTIEFTPVTPPEGKYMNKYVVVYRGGIQSDADHPDSDDTQALATTSFYCGKLWVWDLYDGPGCGEGPGYVYSMVDIWNVSNKSGSPQNLEDGTFEIYYKDMQDQLIPITNVTNSLDYCYECDEEEWDPEPVLQINLGMEWVEAQRLIVIYKGKMVDSENPTDEYDGTAVGSIWVNSIGGWYCDSPLCGCPQ